MELSKLPTLVSIDRLCNLIKYSTHCSGIEGYMVTFGVYKGGSLEVLARFNPEKDIIGIDSFAGLPKETEYDFHREGDFNDVDYHAIAGYFKSVYNNVRIVRGFSPSIFEFFDDHVRFSFVEIDVDMYTSVKEGLEFFLPRMSKGGMIVLDDYKVRSTPGCEKAVTEFLSTYSDYTHAEELKFYGHESSRSHYQYLIVK